ncbi:hypothetical protein [Pseudomonas kurunegalensis]|uniref:Uncharacterized protein n=1 Tax=Pseudomonas kurunegalensis TaxID=485880 RepID=A0ACC5UKL6_9PSED|nr:hypothetical protein [Pseudomonas kurunegalensis]MBV4514999.1 hypothetical protein [Pseudomonas kurunegalensis]
MREQFEAWHASAVVGDPPHDKFNNGDYRNQHVQRYWLGWQASREAVVVELPKFEDYPASMERDMREALRSAIEAQGLKVAP